MINFVDIMKAGGEIYKIFISPGFSTHPPCIVNKDYIPNNIIDAMSKGWLTSYHPPKDIIAFYIKDVFVTGEGLVITSDGDIIAQSVTQNGPQDIEVALSNIKNKSPIIVDEKTLLLRKRGDTNYGHWQIEVLPKLWLADGVIDFQNLLIPHGGPAMNRIYRDSISYSSKRKYNNIYAEKNNVYKLKELLIIDGMTKHGTYMSPLVFSRTDDIIKTVDGIGPKRVFISREGCPRNLDEEEKFFSIIKDMGFVKINPKYMNYIDQLRALKDAEIVIGVLGAGLTNIMFCNKKTRILSICPAEMPDTFFYLISQIRGYDYIEIREKNINGNHGRNSKISWNHQTIHEIKKHCQ